MKAKDDGRRNRADFVVLATSAFPVRTRTLALREDVLLMAPELTGAIAGLLHRAVVSLTKAGAAGSERASKAANGTLGPGWGAFADIWIQCATRFAGG